MALMQTDFPDPVLRRPVGVASRQVGHDGVAIYVFAKRQRHFGFVVRHSSDSANRADHLGFHQVRTRLPLELRREPGPECDSAFSAAAILLLSAVIFSSFTPGAGQFVPSDGRSLGDISQRDFNIELGQRLLHQARIGHEFLFRLGRLHHRVGMLKKVERGERVIADQRCGCNRDRFRLLWREFWFCYWSCRRGRISGFLGGFHTDRINVFCFACP